MLRLWIEIHAADYYKGPKHIHPIAIDEIVPKHQDLSSEEYPSSKEKLHERKLAWN